MRDLALNMIKGEPITIDAKVYGPNEYVYGKDVGLALYLACQAKNPKQRIYNAGTGAVHGAEELAQVSASSRPKPTLKSLARARQIKAAAFRWTSACRRPSWAMRQSFP
jgi:hypothetical protein